jgi:hypothetical protein
VQIALGQTHADDGMTEDLKGSKGVTEFCSVVDHWEGMPVGRVLLAGWWWVLKRSGGTNL